MVKQIIQVISLIISKIIPIGSVLVFNSFPDFTDNAYAVYKYIIDHQQKFDSYKLIWLTLNKEKAQELNKLFAIKNEKCRAYCRFTFCSLWYYYRAKYVFCTHGVFGLLKLSQTNKIINLWHGMPLKGIGVFDKISDNTKADITVATSDYYRDIMAKSFRIDIEKVFLTGQPRNDLLFEMTDFYSFYGIEKDRYSKVGIWLPTYRRSFIGKLREEGIFQENKISYLNFNDLESLDILLQQLKILIIIKIHPMDFLQTIEFPTYKNVLLLKSLNSNIQLYPLLGSTDFLLTDYSSVWIDYDILNKPIGFVMNDIEEYKNDRGLIFDDLENLLPGEILSNTDQLFNFIYNLDKVRYKSKNLFNKYKDNNSTARLLFMLNL